ncbi:pilus assembly protein TadG-related protein [Sulfobacillus harzensis]|uniref:Putative Flp pilus-assembly TadG-like N-terminal domain-containing protein n=1 Tax=Sulfobacillus harzensis TaxID=2729629 RepID=A0A7Y0L8I2_9FIRM|nr:pilus assembly protein TadG-related protein [Sulfobacillus harzensis]NMP24435.1 hypothetical protein [Sulfobacillus harzensis]
MRIDLKNRRGQALPLVALFSGVLVGATALTVDVGRVYVVHNQARAAVSAAALAAAKVITQEVNAAIAADPSTPPSWSSIATAPAQAAADAVYEANMKGSLPSSGLNQEPTVIFEPVSSITLQNYPPGTSQYNTWSAYQGMMVVQVAARGAVSMDFGVAVGVPRVTVSAHAASMVGLETGVPESLLLPLALPASGDSGDALPVPNDMWTSYVQPGQSYFLYRGNKSGHEPSLPPGAPSGTIPVSFLNLFGSGNDGILAYTAGGYVQVGKTVAVHGKTGSAEWNTLGSLPANETVMLPVGDSVHNGNGDVAIVGFVTATVVGSNGSNGTNAGFVLTIKQVYAETPQAALSGIPSTSSGYSPTASYRLIATP